MPGIDKFEEYKLFIDDTARLSERRQGVSNTYVTVNGAIVGVITFFVKDARLTNWWLILAILPLIAAGIATCYYWHELLKTYRTLINFRFDRIEAMERDDLPGCAQIYEAEAARYFRGAPAKDHIGFSQIEMKLPWIFAALYALLLLGTTFATALVSASVVPAPALLP